MDRTKLINDNGMHLYKDSDFNTFNITISFIANPNNRECAIYDLLCEYMLKANKKYSETDIAKKIKELYCIDIDFLTHTYGSKRLFEATLNIVSPKAVEDDYTEDAYAFARDLLLYPDFDRPDILETIKRVKLSGAKSDVSEPFEKIDSLYHGKVVYRPQTEYENSIDLDYIKKMIDSISLDDLKALYEKTINEQSFYRGLAFGDISDEEFKRFRKFFPYKTSQELLDFTGNYEVIDSDLTLYDDSIRESTVYITYSIGELNRGARDLLFEILSGSGDLCIDILREKYGLVYYTDSEIFFFGDYLYIVAEVDKRNIKDLIRGVNEIVEIIKDPEKLKPLLEKAKEAIKQEDYIISENQSAMFLELFNKIIGVNKEFDYDQFLRGIDDIKPEDITKLTKDMKRQNIFVYRGDA